MRTINRRPLLTSSLRDVKEPTHYSRRVGDKVTGVLAVLFSPAEVAGLAVMSLKRPPKQKQPQVKKGLCRVLENVDVGVAPPYKLKLFLK